MIKNWLCRLTAILYSFIFFLFKSPETGGVLLDYIHFLHSTPFQTIRAEKVLPVFISEWRFNVGSDLDSVGQIEWNGKIRIQNEDEMDFFDINLPLSV